MPVTYGDLTFDRLGHATIRLETGDGRVMYIDPWHQAFATAPHDGDIVIVTHDDTDHYDPTGIEAVAGQDATVAAFEAIDTRELDHDVVPLPFDGSTTVDGLAVESIPAYNDPEGDHVDDEGEPFHAEGEVIGVILSIGATTVYYASDTDFLAHHKAIQVDLFIPPIGGHYTMDRHEAAAFAVSVEPDLVLPVHYDSFPEIETDVDAFVDELAAAEIRVEVL